jgi:hypothetical protein
MSHGRTQATVTILSPAIDPPFSLLPSAPCLLFLRYVILFLCVHSVHDVHFVHALLCPSVPICANLWPVLQCLTPMTPMTPMCPIGPISSSDISNVKSEICLSPYIFPPLATSSLRKARRRLRKVRRPLWIFLIYFRPRKPPIFSVLPHK